MSCDTGDVNVCLSRMGGFSEHLASHSQPPASATSLLTFADMVLALDNRIVDDDMKDSSKRENLRDDHNYASNKSHKMTTRSQSQAMRINKKQSENPYYLEDLDSRNDRDSQCLSNSDPGAISSYDLPQSSRHDGYHSCSIHKRSDDSLTCGTCGSNSYHEKTKQDIEIKVKRSSSVENITADSPAIDSFSEWPQTARKNSPRKSCSFEEVNKNSTGSRKSEDKFKKGGSSGQLHRLVNDTLEFPCWPRKADHTYATATWDGTAASHGIFEQEMNQIDSRTDDFKMEVTEALVLPLKKRSLNAHLDELQKSNYPYQQKDDHTYVKQNTNSNSTSNFSGYTCSTFPRQKSRDDHTYFSSGLHKNGSGSSGKDWNSVHTVGNLSHTQGKERSDSAGNRNVVPEIISAKKDHNYFTSAR